jgi:predicted short-subunit dehydrogenase-like oxidoreductase (DUF2520 family)
MPFSYRPNLRLVPYFCLHSSLLTCSPLTGSPLTACRPSAFILHPSYFAFMAILNIIGCGRVGRTLGRLWAQSGAFAIGDAYDRSSGANHSAIVFIGAGRAVPRVADMQRADAWMLTPPDDEIAAACAEVAASGRLAKGVVVFHCSGALPSAVLTPAIDSGALVASVHPLKSFADPVSACQTFAGTACAMEGNAGALAVLEPAFQHIGATLQEIDADAKTLYHAASVIVCNYLPALMEAGLRCFEKAGYERSAALRMVEPLVRETLANVFRLGPVKALTGPIARGDDAVVARHLVALPDPLIASIYRELGKITVQLAHAQGGISDDALNRIEQLLKDEARKQ